MAYDYSSWTWNLTRNPYPSYKEEEGTSDPG